MARSPTQKIPHREVHEELTALTRWLGWGPPAQCSTTFNNPEGFAAHFRERLGPELRSRDTMSPAAMTTTAAITTADQLLETADIGRCELVRGELIRMTPAGANHGRIAATLTRLIGQHVVAHDLGVVLAAETGFLIAQEPDSVRAPDVAFIRSDRLDLLPERGFFPGAPDLAVEVLSPDDGAGDVLAKVQDWLSAGTAEVWVVDPKHRSVSIYRLSDPGRVQASVSRNTDEVTTDLLPGLRIMAAEIFDKPRE